jgi:DNA-binding MarR family transcriptional regulator
MAISPPTVTSVVDGLVSRGLVERRPDPSDRRRLRLLLTPAGEGAVSQADAAVEARMAGLLGRLADDRASAALAALADWRDALDLHLEARGPTSALAAGTPAAAPAAAASAAAPAATARP